MFQVVLKNVKEPTRYIAAKPNDRRSSFAGSGLPFPSRDIAMQGTPNRGLAVPDTNGLVVIYLVMPGSFYDNQTFVPPTLFFGDKQIPLAPAIPSRTLSVVKKLDDYYSQFGRPILSTVDIFKHTAYPAFCYGETYQERILQR